MEVLLELALAAKRDVLLVGPHGAGKTTICRHFLQSRGTYKINLDFKIKIVSLIFILHSYEQWRYRDAEASGVQ